MSSNRLDLKVGDRVVAIKDIMMYIPTRGCSGLFSRDEIPTGSSGVIKGFTDSSIGVEWDDDIQGHTLGGLCENGHGWWLPMCTNEIEKVIEWNSSDMHDFLLGFALPL